MLQSVSQFQVLRPGVEKPSSGQCRERGDLNIIKKRQNMQLYGWCLLALFVVALLPGAAARARPVWELGAGGGVLAFPAYRGSSRYDVLPLPMPYLTFQSEHLRIDREGLRGLLFDGSRLDFDISLNGSLPARRGKIPEREGMPALDPVFEFGPSLDWRMSEPGARVQWKLRLPVRSVFSISENGISQIGWLTHPEVSMRWYGAIADWDMGASIGLLFGDHRYHAHYYDVSPSQVLPQRPAYRSGSGYSGTAGQVSFSRRKGRLWIGAFARFDSLTHAVFEDSPLVSSRHSLTGGIGMAWVLWQSRSATSADSGPAEVVRIND